MSRTDAHRPGWVQRYDYTMPTVVDHDHRYGECVEETLETARFFATHRSRNHRCPRLWFTTRYCGGACDWYWSPPGTVPPGCSGHRMYYNDPEIPCVHCDSRPAVPTCSPDFNRRYGWYASKVYGSTPPSWYVHAEYHYPERRRVRDELTDARRRYNSGEDLDGLDIENRQARSSAKRNWW